MAEVSGQVAAASLLLALTAAGCAQPAPPAPAQPASLVAPTPEDTPQEPGRWWDEAERREHEAWQRELRARYRLDDLRPEALAKSAQSAATPQQRVAETCLLALVQPLADADLAAALAGWPSALRVDLLTHSSNLARAEVWTASAHVGFEHYDFVARAFVRLRAPAATNGESALARALRGLPWPDLAAAPPVFERALAPFPRAGRTTLMITVPGKGARVVDFEGGARTAEPLHDAVIGQVRSQKAAAEARMRVQVREGALRRAIDGDLDGVHLVVNLSAPLGPQSGFQAVLRDGLFEAWDAGAQRGGPAPSSAMKALLGELERDGLFAASEEFEWWVDEATVTFSLRVDADVGEIRLDRHFPPRVFRERHPTVAARLDELLGRCSPSAKERWGW